MQNDVQQYIGDTAASFNLFSVSSIKINAIVEQNYKYINISNI